jgi:hypothetical protein
MAGITGDSRESFLEILKDFPRLLRDKKSTLNVEALLTVPGNIKRAENMG